MADSIDFELIFRSLSGLYVLLNKKLEILNASDNYLKATLVSRQNVIGRHFFDIFPANPKEENADGVVFLKDSFERVLQTQAPVATAIQKYDIPKAENSLEFEERYWGGVATPIFSPAGEINYILLKIEDVTEFIKLKQLEKKEREQTEELRLHTEEVELIVYQRAVQIQEANKELRKVNQELEKSNQALMTANRELESFSSSVAHDLRNPLSVIKSIASLLRQTNTLDQKGKDYLERILVAERRMENLINDLLVFSGAIKSQLEFEEVDLLALVKSIISQVNDQIDGRSINWILPQEAVVKGDRRLLRIAFDNLLSNSLKYTSQKPEAVIEFGIIKEHPTVFFIKDNGVGFSMEEASKLFLPFSRLKSSMNFPGNGIGLSIVKRIIERHGGKIWAEGQLEQGSTFYFTLDPK